MKKNYVTKKKNKNTCSKKKSLLSLIKTFKIKLKSIQN